MKRLALLVAVLSLALTTSAGAKGPTAAKVCGADGCERMHFGRLSAAGGPVDPLSLIDPIVGMRRESAPPTRSSGWFEVTMYFGSLRERLAFLEDPAYLRVRGQPEAVLGSREPKGSYTWVRLEGRNASSYEEISQGLAPRPLADLPDLRTTAPRLAAATEAAAADESGASRVWILVAAAALGVCAAAIFLLGRRRGQPARKLAL